ncbi:putative baseplate assembly protein [Georgenia subflava]|uniref:Putative baseplate assembly protein n=1 Tax=Georgenia subflava TaxID=1622177 RepID=A0A6N7EME8_9MICO|nr:putative baseplate assembly protein [Georgenia subflava]MPV37316.1 putative baseplate assembly protein [Georgenia subflava]
MNDCGCEVPDAGPANPPGADRLRRRVTAHSTSLARMRGDLAAGAPGRPEKLRTLARHPADDPAIALLDTWALVADVVTFYSERIAQEGFLRTATERRSVRELARTLGHELRPGVAAEVDLVLEAQTAPGAPAVVTVPRATPVRSVPGAGELPQIFETGTDLEARGVWNHLPVRASAPQELALGTAEIWLRTPTTPVRPGDTVLVVGDERVAYAALAPADRPPFADWAETWAARRVVAVTAEPDGRTGWVRLDLDRPLGHTPDRPLVPQKHPRVHLLTERTRVFGHQAPDPSLLVTEDGGPPGASPVPDLREDPREDPAPPTRKRWVWDGIDAFDPADVVELDGDHPGVVVGSWLVLEEPDHAAAVQIVAATPDGAARWGLAGPVTRVQVDLAEQLGALTPRRVKVHGTSVALPAEEVPLTGPVTGTPVLQVPATDPPLPPGRAVLVEGTDAADGQRRTELAAVVSCAAGPGAEWMTLTLDHPLVHGYAPASLVVHGNVVTATHGESVAQVLGSGDGRTDFAEVRPRRGPLTHVRSTTPGGTRAELTVRVDGVAWQQVPGLDAAGPQDRVYVLRHEEDAPPRVVFGDGSHGARPAAGEENITAAYRVGIGAEGAVGADQVSQLVRRPLGLHAVTNPAPAHGWAPAETLEDARRGAPLLVRTLDRVVSAADLTDFAHGYAGVGPARTDTVWDGRRTRLVLTVRGVDATDPGPALLTDLAAAVEQVRDPGTPVHVLVGDVLDLGVSVLVEHDPAYERADVEAAVRSALAHALGPPARAFARPVTAAEALVVVRGVAGVLACTMPVLTDLGGTDPSPVVLRARPGRYDPAVPGPLPAELPALATDVVVIGVMT